MTNVVQFNKTRNGDVVDVLVSSCIGSNDWIITPMTIHARKWLIANVVGFQVCLDAVIVPQEKLEGMHARISRAGFNIKLM